MDTPICDFVSQYAATEPLRLHMPGHKGFSVLGLEALDITEIDGADSLYDAKGIICQSEENASKIFGNHTYYSTEGSSLCIRAMLYLCVLYAREQRKKPLIAAARNIHSTFIRAAAMLDFSIYWFYGNRLNGYLSCVIDPYMLDEWLTTVDNKPVAVYLTSPDYLGNVADIRTISRICHKHGVLLLVDNAHGAYMRFLPSSEHPIDLGADLCCDSAHKTLPVLTGGAYLHIANYAPDLFRQFAKQALAMFGSTSPSYLILQSLDAVNRHLDQDYPKQLSAFLPACEQLKGELADRGYSFIGTEPLKLTINCRKYGYSGSELARHMNDKNIYVEFYDPDYLVLMLTPDIGFSGLIQLKSALLGIPRKMPLSDCAPLSIPGTQIMTPRQASFSPCEIIPVSESLGRVLASPSVGCPPAVPIIVCGEQINENTVRCFQYYGIDTCCVTIGES